MEILFRGFHPDKRGGQTIVVDGKKVKGEWVYGYYIKAKNHWHNHGIHEDWIAGGAVQNGGRFALGIRHPVIPSTVCEYTGRDAYLKRKDIIKCKLFEGDICEVTVFDHNGIDTQHICKIEYLSGSFCFVGIGEYDFLWPLSDVDDTESDVDVIGTVWDEVE